MNYKIIKTGSDGNAIVVEDIILIDCGVSFKKIKKYFSKIKIVLLTHIHSDHFNKTTIIKLAKERPTLRFACCEWLVEELINCGVSKSNIDVLKIGKRYNYKIFKIQPIKAYHDVPNCGYRIFINDKKILYITDTNTLRGLEAKNYDLYLIEANYENEEELQNRIHEKTENGKYVYEYRVKDTHLSKEEMEQFVLDNAGDKSLFDYLHMHKER